MKFNPGIRGFSLLKLPLTPLSCQIQFVWRTSWILIFYDKMQSYIFFTEILSSECSYTGPKANDIDQIFHHVVSMP
jgi:hypothetical protein